MIKLRSGGNKRGLRDRLRGLVRSIFCYQSPLVESEETPPDSPELPPTAHRYSALMSEAYLPGSLQFKDLDNDHGLS